MSDFCNPVGAMHLWKRTGKFLSKIFSETKISKSNAVYGGPTANQVSIPGGPLLNGPLFFAIGVFLQRAELPQGDKRVYAGQ